jgi:hypothetical protein
MITTYCGALASAAIVNTHTAYSLSALHYTSTESYWYAVPLALGYRLPKADVQLLGFPNYPRQTATTALDSQCCH